MVAFARPDESGLSTVDCATEVEAGRGVTLRHCGVAGVSRAEAWITKPIGTVARDVLVVVEGIGEPPRFAGHGMAKPQRCRSRSNRFAKECSATALACPRAAI